MMPDKDRLKPQYPVPGGGSMEKLALRRAIAFSYNLAHAQPDRAAPG